MDTTRSNSKVSFFQLFVGVYECMFFRTFLSLMYALSDRQLHGYSAGEIPLTSGKIIEILTKDGKTAFNEI